MSDYTELDRVHCVDIFDLCAAQPSQSVDCILCDLPYGTTTCAWDSVIPFEPMWAAFKRVIKPRGAIVLTASQPFTSALVMSNPKWFRYEWVWNKKLPVNFLNANSQPLKIHESVLVFSEAQSNYYPIMRKGVYRAKNFPDKTKGVYGARGNILKYNDDYFPVSLLEYHNANQSEKEHPTQKPVDLFRYLIRTYTQPGELILDPCAGSGTTALAAREEQRHFICGDSSPEYVTIAQKRLALPYTLPMFAAGD